MTSYWDLFPSDVKTIIYQMNPEHRELFNSLKDDLEVAAVKNRLHLLQCASNKPLTDRFLNDIDDPDYVIRKLHSCKCCERHAKKKPLSLTDIGDFDPTTPYSANLAKSANYTGFNKSNNCGCFCRSFSRLMFGVHNDQENIEIIEDILNLQDDFLDVDEESLFWDLVSTM